MTDWIPVHEESLRGDTTIEAWLQDDPKNLIFIRNDQGLSYRVYSTMEDAVNGDTSVALADVCYGWYTLLWEQQGHKAHSDFLKDCDTRSAEGHGVPFECHDNAGLCEDAFHAAQVLLENEECAGCDACTENRVSVPEALA